jgi:hypothetical protein
MKAIMPYQFPRSFRCLPAAGGLLLGLALLLCGSATAQELIQNGNFEAPFPGTDATTNWTLVYVDGGPSDFAIAGQTTEASRANGGRGAHLRARNWNYAHAYFKQIVRTGITNGGHYLLSIQKMKAGFKYADEGPDYKLKVYMTALSGTSSNAVSANSTDVGPYSLIVTGTPSRSVEIQLHMWKSAMSNESAEDPKHMKCTGWFDDISLVWTNSP